MFIATLPCLAKDSESQAKTRFRSWLRSMSEIEARVKTIQPMHIAREKRTRQEDREIMRRIEYLDAINSKDVPAVAREVNNYRDCPDSLALAYQSLRDAEGAFANWVGTKLELQNAGVNNPGLESLRKNEPLRYQDYRKAFEAAEKAIK